MDYMYPPRNDERHQESKAGAAIPTKVFSDAPVIQQSISIQN